MGLPPHSLGLWEDGECPTRLAHTRTASTCQVPGTVQPREAPGPRSHGAVTVTRVAGRCEWEEPTPGGQGQPASWGAEFEMSFE